MGQTADQIKSHIDGKRVDLRSNLQELEDKVRCTADWRCHFERRPFIFLGLALGGGMLVANMAGSHRKRRGRHEYVSPNYHRTTTTGSDSYIREGDSESPVHINDKGSRAWGLLQNALIGLAATHVKDYVEKIIPGFSEHYRKAETKQGQ
ncbi:MAG: hypothetical protein ABI076_04770 [Acidobacteriaceae bacterium]